MWEIFEHRRTWKQLDRLPRDVLKRYEKWKDIVQISGPTSLAAIKGFHDEALHGKWKGHRSSRLGLQYRVFYTADILIRRHPVLHGIFVKHAGIAMGAAIALKVPR